MSKMPKVLWVSHFAPYPPKGGAMQRAFNMLKECSGFADIDFVSLLPTSKVNAYFFDYDAGLTEIERNLKPFCRSLSLIEHGASSRMTNKVLNAAATLLSEDPYDVVALRSTRFTALVNKMLSEEAYDIIYVDTIGLCPALPSDRKSMVLNHHNIESQMLTRRADLAKGAMKLFLKWQAAKTQSLEQKYCGKYAVNLTCSDLDSQRLAQMVDCRPVTIPNGVDLSYFTRNKPYRHDKTKGAIFAGGLDWYPNAAAIDFIIEQMEPELTRRGLDIPVTIYGKGRHKRLEGASARDDNQIIKGGFVDDIRTPMEQARMYVCPITDGGGTKLKVLDALAMGIPLIANPIACEGIDVVDGTHVILAQTPQEFVHAMARLDEDPELCRAMSEAGTALISEKYSYQSIGQQLRLAFQGALA